MSKGKDHQNMISIEECLEDCYFASKWCYEKADGTFVCPIDYHKCEDKCHERLSS